MTEPDQLLLGEFRRNLDDRFRVCVPEPFATALIEPSADCLLVKERPGCLSLWNAEKWNGKLQEGVDDIKHKIQRGKLDGRISQVQILGRLLSSRHATVMLAGKTRRLSIPDGFRPFLGVEPASDVMVVGAAVCVEIWRPDAWLKYLEVGMPEFRQLFEKLAE